MRKFLSVAIGTLWVGVGLAQTPDEITGTLKFIESLRDARTGAYAVNPAKSGEALQPSVRACNGAVKAIRALGAKVSDPERIERFVLSRYDSKAGSFSEPGEKPTATVTSIGVIVALELGLSKEQFKPAMLNISKTAKGFEEVRIGAAAVEAWGYADCPFDCKEWVDICTQEVPALQKSIDAKTKTGDARGIAGVLVAVLRMPVVKIEPEAMKELMPVILNSQQADGGWKKPDAKSSDLESTYRVVRFLKMTDTAPKDTAALQKYLASCRRADGGYGVNSTAESSMSGVYYFAVVSKWLTEFGKK